MRVYSLIVFLILSNIISAQGVKIKKDMLYGSWEAIQSNSRDAKIHDNITFYPDKRFETTYKASTVNEGKWQLRNGTLYLKSCIHSYDNPYKCRKQHWDIDVEHVSRDTLQIMQHGNVQVIYKRLQSKAPDTVCMDKRVNYYSETDTIDVLGNIGKGSYYKAKYAREHIIFNSDSSKIERCFYYDNKRYLHEYEIFAFSTSGDSVFKIYYKGYVANWGVTKVNDSLYALQNKYGKLTETGYAESLHPFKAKGSFVITNAQLDMLCVNRYNRYIYPIAEWQSVDIVDTVYSICDKMPTYKNGVSDLLKDIGVNIRMPLAESSVMCTRVYCSFIVNKLGEVVNVSIDRGCGDTIVENSVVRSIYNLDTFIPGQHNGKSVNVKITLPVRIALY